MVTQSEVLYPAKIGANRLHFREAMDAQTRLASGASRAGMGRVVAFDLYQGTTLHAAESRISQRLGRAGLKASVQALIRLGVGFKPTAHFVFAEKCG